MKLGMYIMAPETHLNGVRYESLPSLCVSVSVSILKLLNEGLVKCNPPFVARKRLGKDVSAPTNAHAIVEEILDACVCIPCNNSVKTFPWQRRIFRGVVFYDVHVVIKESRRF
jgi:hypothetical protein